MSKPLSHEQASFLGLTAAFVAGMVVLGLIYTVPRINSSFEANESDAARTGLVGKCDDPNNANLDICRKVMGRTYR